MMRHCHPLLELECWTCWNPNFPIVSWEPTVASSSETHCSSLLYWVGAYLTSCWSTVGKSIISSLSVVIKCYAAFQLSVLPALAHYFLYINILLNVLLAHPPLRTTITNFLSYFFTAFSHTFYTHGTSL